MPKSARHISYVFCILTVAVSQFNDLLAQRTNESTLTTTISAAVPPPTQPPSGEANASLNVSPIWPDLAPGETTRLTGTKLPPRPNDPSITRVENITAPTVEFFPAKTPSGTAVMILPGGGYNYVVPNKEGSAAAPFLNDLGISVFVLSYRVSGDKSNDAWKKPVQDAQRGLRWIRANAEKFNIAPDKVGLMGFSAGGQAATITTTATAPQYEAVDEVDQQPYAPNFSILVYPWKLENKNGGLRSVITVSKQTPKTLIVHTHDDRSAISTGAAKLYIALKEHKVDAELHIFRTGGHGYGLTKRDNSVVDQWPNLATDWLRLHGLTN